MTTLTKGQLHQIDTDIAEKVMGWRLDPNTRMWRGVENVGKVDTTIMAYPPAPQYQMCSNRYWRPSTDIRDAMTVVEFLRQNEFHVELLGTQHRWRCRVEKTAEKRLVWMDDEPMIELAICRVALQVVREVDRR